MEDPSNNTVETDEETVALRKKRLRRVSFADREITSVHIFKRDEDYETPPYSSDSKPRGSEIAEADNKEVPGFCRDLADSDDSRELLCTPAGERDEDDGGTPFLRPVESPSSWGTTGSATSNDEDNFVGPVSANFIRQRRLSDSAASEENHDFTMDSTAFSMHFRSLVGSESGDLRTPTENLAHEDKTPSQVATPSDVMVLTKAKKLFPKSPLAIERVSGGRDFNDMSLAGDSTFKYDYGKLSPGLEALLAEENRDFPAMAASENIYTNSSRIDAAIDHQDRSSAVELLNDGDTEGHNFDGHEVCAPQSSSELGEANGSSKSTPTNQITHESKPRVFNYLTIPAAVDHHVQTPDGFNREREPQEDLNGMRMPNIKLLDVKGTRHDIEDDCQHNPFMHREFKSKLYDGFQSEENSHKHGRHDSGSNPVASQQDKSPEMGSLPNKLPPKLLDSASSVRSLSFITPSPKPSRSFLSKGSFIQAETLLSIQRSNSKAKPVMTSSAASNLKDRIENLKLKLSGYRSSIASPSNFVKPEIGKDLKHRHVNVPPANLEEQLSNAESLPKNSTNPEGDSPEGDRSDLSNEVVGTNLLPKNAQSRSNALARVAQGKFAPPRTALASPSKQVKGYRLVSENLAEQTPVITRSDSSSAEITSDQRKTKLAIGMDDKCKSLTLNEANNKMLPLTDSGLLKLHDQCSELLSATRETDLVENVSKGDSSTTMQGNLDSMLIENRVRSLAQNTSAPENPMQSPSALRLKRPSPFNKESPNGWQGQHKLFVGKGGRSPNFKLYESVYDGHSQGSYISSGQKSEQDIENSCRRKRKIEEAILGDAYSSFKSHGTQRSPKGYNSSRPVLVLDQSDASITGNGSVKNGTMSIDWRDISQKLSAEANQLLAQVTDRLNIRLIGILEDRLAHLRRVHLFEMLCFEIHSQNVYNLSSTGREKRQAEARSLLCKLAYENAKVQILYMKREKMQKRVEILTSGIQKSVLRLNCIKHLRQPVRRDAQVDAYYHTASLANFGHEANTEKASKMRQEVEILDRKINNLKQSFHLYCKVKGEPSCSDAIVCLKNHLEKKIRCRLIRQAMQLCEVDGLQNRSHEHDIHLNYIGFVTQRLTIKAGTASSIIVSNKLNDLTIMKNFPNMDAWTAFAFVFNSESSAKYATSKALARETQTTSSIIRNLLDVLEELQVARLELQNLTHTSFDSPSAEQLHLQLRFIDCRRFRKVAVALDMACLTSGVYPSVILPCEVHASGTMAENSSSQNLATEIRAACRSLRNGYPRLIRLCSCISKLLLA